MKIGPRSRIWPSVGGFRTELPKGTTVSNSAKLCRDLQLIQRVGKKLKRRLEDLEKRTETASASPPQIPARLQHQQDHKESAQKENRSPEIIDQQPSPRILQNQYKPPMEDNLMSRSSLEQEGSRTPPLLVYRTYHPYQQPHCPDFPAGYQCGDCLTPVPSMLHLREGDTICQFDMSYPGFPIIDLHVSRGYEDSNLREDNPEPMPAVANWIPFSYSCEHST
jgi:hypothetical protein